MDNGLKTIMELFNGNKVFRVPMYQRSYAWDNKQLNDFLEDMKNQKKSRDYFLGTVLLEKAENDEDFRVIDIVDGQQRITTLVIFMKSLIDILKKINQDVEILEDTYVTYKNRFKLKLQDEDSEFFETYVLGDVNNPEIVMGRPSQKRLLEARRFFTDKLKNLSLQDLLEIKDKINKTRVLTYTVEDNAESTLIFETTNDRGKSLTNLEKIKSFLMYKCYLATDEPADMLKSLYKRFSDIYGLIDSINIDSEDSILQYHFIAYEMWGSKRDYQEYLQNIKNKINQLLLDKQDKEVVRYIENYTTKLRETFFTLYEIQKNKTIRPLQEVFMLERLGITFYPLLIKSYQLDKSQNKQNFENIARLVEIFSFRVLGMKAKRQGDVDSAVNLLVREFNGDFEKLEIQLVDKIIEYCNDLKFKEKVGSNDFYEEFTSDRVYFFWKYENFLRGLKGYAPMSQEDYSSDKRFELTIEHIAPQNPEEEEDRIIATEKCQFPDYNTEEFKEVYLHSIGNLTFDPRSANSSKGRKPVPEKDNQYFRRAPLMTQNELQDFLDNGQWSVNSITKRRENLIDFALKVWDPIEIVGQSKYQGYKKNIEKGGNKDTRFTEDYVRTRMSGETYLLLMEFRRRLAEITDYEEKVNQEFIGFKNNKYYFVRLYWRQNFLCFWMDSMEKEEVPKDQNVTFFPDYNGLEIKIYSKEDIERLIPIIKKSKRFKK